MATLAGMSAGNQRSGGEGSGGHCASVEEGNHNAARPEQKGHSGDEEPSSVRHLVFNKGTPARDPKSATLNPTLVWNGAHGSVRHNLKVCI